MANRQIFVKNQELATKAYADSSFAAAKSYADDKDTIVKNYVDTEISNVKEVIDDNCPVFTFDRKSSSVSMVPITQMGVLVNTNGMNALDIPLEDRQHMYNLISEGKRFKINITAYININIPGYNYSSVPYYEVITDSLGGSAQNRTATLVGSALTYNNNMHGVITEFIYLKIDSSYRFTDFRVYYKLDDFLDLTNTKTYTPTGDYNPATKKYVDDAIAAYETASIPETLLNISTGSTSTEIIENLGGSDNVTKILSAIENNKQIIGLSTVNGEYVGMPLLIASVDMNGSRIIYMEGMTKIYGENIYYHHYEFVVTNGEWSCMKYQRDRMLTESQISENYVTKEYFDQTIGDINAALARLVAVDGDEEEF